MLCKIIHFQMQLQKKICFSCKNCCHKKKVDTFLQKCVNFFFMATVFTRKTDFFLQLHLKMDDFAQHPPKVSKRYYSVATGVSFLVFSALNIWSSDVPLYTLTCTEKSPVLHWVSYIRIHLRLFRRHSTIKWWTYVITVFKKNMNSSVCPTCFHRSRAGG